MKNIMILALLLFSAFSFAQGTDTEIITTFNVSLENLDLSSLDLDYTHVLKARGTRTGDLWTVYVTLRHDDTSWSHYADRWQILDTATGDILAERVLAHPHETEQPFTRSLVRITIPDSVDMITVRGACQVHGFGGTEIVIDLQ